MKLTDLESFNNLLDKTGLYTEQSNLGDSIVKDIFCDDCTFVVWFTPEGKIKEVVQHENQ